MPQAWIPPGGELEKKSYLHRAVEMKQPHTMTEPFKKSCPARKADRNRMIYHGVSPKAARAAVLALAESGWVQPALPTKRAAPMIRNASSTIWMPDVGML